MAGDAERIRQLLNKGAPIDYKRKSGLGDFPLMAAARGGNYEAVKVLLGNGAAADAKDASEETALHVAAELEVGRGASDIIDLLLAYGAKADAESHIGETALHLASSKGNPLAVESLLAGGANPRKTDGNGWTPLHRAAFGGFDFIVAKLMEFGADPRAETNMGSTPLDLAINAGKASLVGAVLKKEMRRLDKGDFGKVETGKKSSRAIGMKKARPKSDKAQGGKQSVSATKRVGSAALDESKRKAEERSADEAPSRKEVAVERDSSKSSSNKKTSDWRKSI